MGERTIRMPDVGEGVAEAEVVEWHVAVGDLVREDQVLAAVMTDKATVEIPSPADGRVIWLGGEIGERLAVGAPLIRLEVAGEGEAAAAPVAGRPASEVSAEPAPVRTQPGTQESGGRAGAGSGATPPGAPGRPLRREPVAPRPEGEKPMAAPSVRARAVAAGIDLRRVAGSGPAGRITHDDIDRIMAGAGDRAAAAPGLTPDMSSERIRVIGLRRRIAERMALAKSRIAHITYVEEVDVTALEDLRAALNRDLPEDRPRLTILPFLMRAIVRAVAVQPEMNARFDDEAGEIERFGGVHLGIATQTPSGLMVPVVRHSEARDLWDCAAELARVSAAARSGSARPEELSGSTLTITSLGALGGVVSTPVINHPEVAIVGVNKIAVRPVWDGTGFVPRKMMNLSSSFDHRVIDGWDAARFIQKIRSLLENPALIFVEG